MNVPNTEIILVEWNSPSIAGGVHKLIEEMLPPAIIYLDQTIVNSRVDIEKMLSSGLVQLDPFSTLEHMVTGKTATDLITGELRIYAETCNELAIELTFTAIEKIDVSDKVGRYNTLDYDAGQDTTAPPPKTFRTLDFSPGKDVKQNKTKEPTRVLDLNRKKRGR